MPVMPPTLGGRSKAERDREYDTVRRREKPWRAWYSLAAWRARRAEQLAREPLCERHLARGVAKPATVANHVVPHRGAWDLFIGGKLESLCKPCHDSEVQREERRAGQAGGVGQKSRA